MDSVVDIVKSWWYYARGTEETKELIKRRMEICVECPHFVNDLGFSRCGKCGCPLSARTANPDLSCPDTPKRWTAVKDESFF